MDIMFRKRRQSTKGDLVKADKLVRELLRIRSRLYDAGHHLLGTTISLLAGILGAQGNLGSEAQEMHESSLAIDIRNCGSEGVNTAGSYFKMGLFYFRQAQERRQTTETRKEYLLTSATEKRYEYILRHMVPIIQILCEHHLGYPSLHRSYLRL
jgi:hypothetical protein